MKKILFITIVIIFIPFMIVCFYKIDEKKEIKLNYVSNTIIRVKRISTENIEFLPLEEYIVGVLAGEMPIYFEKEAFKAQGDRWLQYEPDTAEGLWGSGWNSFRAQQAGGFGWRGLFSRWF